MVEVIHGDRPSFVVPRQGVLYIWFKPDGTAWLLKDRLTWVEWKKGRSIGECLKEST